MGLCEIPTNPVENIQWSVCPNNIMQTNRFSFIASYFLNDYYTIFDHLKNHFSWLSSFIMISCQNIEGRIPKKENILTGQIVNISTSLQQNQLWENSNSFQIDRKCPTYLHIPNNIKTIQPYRLLHFYIFITLQLG